MGKKSCREILRTIDAMLQRKIPSPGQNFRILPIWSQVPGKFSNVTHLVPSTRLGLCRVRSATPALLNFTPAIHKVSLHNFPVLIFLP